MISEFWIAHDLLGNIGLVLFGVYAGVMLLGLRIDLESAVQVFVSQVWRRFGEGSPKFTQARCEILSIVFMCYMGGSPSAIETIVKKLPWPSACRKDDTRNHGCFNALAQRMAETAVTKGAALCTDFATSATKTQCCIFHRVLHVDIYKTMFTFRSCHNPICTGIL